LDDGTGEGKRDWTIWPASFAVDVIRIGSWFGGDERRLGDWNSRDDGSDGMDGRPNVGLIARSVSFLSIHRLTKSAD